MDLCNRRRFLHTCATGAASLAGLHVASQPAQAANTIVWLTPRNGFTRVEMQILSQTMKHLATHMTSNNVIAETYRIAQRAFIYPGYFNAISLPNRADWIRSCMHVQLAYYLRRGFPRIRVVPYSRGTFEWAFAPIGVARTLAITQRTGRMAGGLQIHVNRAHFRSRWGNNPIVWAGVLGHELLHNLGHCHGNMEYGTHLQINAFQAALQAAAQKGLQRDLQVGESPHRCCSCEDSTKRGLVGSERDLEKGDWEEHR